ncbi:tetratricopeptide repeat protein [Luteolibacter sp. Populi]|uniref:tetratricopeptide repeat protein n=1 Tax=Luteolibacter sp. Populi TaxID=3230487 RepID=UPI0034656BE3
MDLDALKAALAASPDNIPLLMLVGKLHEDRFELADARACFDRVLALQPENGEAHVAVARLLDLAGESSQAAVRLESLCARQPKLASAWLLRARIALDEGDALSARGFYDTAVDLDRAQADDELFQAILKSGGSKKVAMTSAGTFKEEEDDDDGANPFEGMDAVTARDLDIEFRVRADIKFEDIGGMEKVKEDIRMKIIHPLKNPELFAAYG